MIITFCIKYSELMLLIQAIKSYCFVTEQLCRNVILYSIVCYLKQLIPNELIRSDVVFGNITIMILQ